MIEADSLADAQALALADPAITSGMASFDVGTMFVAMRPDASGTASA